MTTSNNADCPEWCEITHSDEEIQRKDFYHGRSFGLYEDGTPGVIEVGVIQSDGDFREPEVVIDTIQMTSAQDLRDLARDCLEAADWMDTNLGKQLEAVSHGN